MKSTLIIYLQRENAESGENEHLFIPLFPHRPCLLHLLKQFLWAQSVGSGHQGAYSRTATKNNNKNITSKLMDNWKTLKQCTD